MSNGARNAILAILTLLAAGCAMRWEEARKRDSLEVYEKFIAENPKDPKAEEAKSRAKELVADRSAYEMAVRAGSDDALKRYVAEHPAGRYAERAKDRLAVTEQRRSLEIRALTLADQSPRWLMGDRDQSNSTFVVFSPDGARVAYADASDKSRIAVQTAYDGAGYGSYYGGGQFLCGAYSPDGRHFAAGAADGIAYVWHEDREGVRVHTPNLQLKHGGAVTALAFDAEDAEFATACEDGTIRVWDFRTGELLQSFPGGDALRYRSVWSLRYAPGGRLLAFDLESAAVAVWDVRKGSPLARFEELAGVPKNAVLSPDGSHLAVAEVDRSPGTEMPYRVQLFDLETRSVRTIYHGFPNDRGYVLSLAFSPDGQELASSGGRTLAVWDVPTAGLLGEHITLPDKRALRRNDYRESRVSPVAFSPDGRFVLAIDLFGARLWDNRLDRGSLAQRPPDLLVQEKAPVDDAVVTPDGKEILEGCEDGSIKVWDAKTGGLLRTFTGFPADGRWTRHLEVTPDGKRVVFPGPGAEVSVLDLQTGRPVFAVAGHTKRVLATALSPDGRTLVSGGDDGSIRLWDLSTGESKSTLEAGGYVSALAFSRDGQRLFGGLGRRGWAVWNMSGGPAKITGADMGQVNALAVDPLNRAAAAMASGEVEFVNLEATAQYRNLAPEHEGGAVCVAFSPDGSRLASGGNDHRVLLVALDGEEEVLRTSYDFGTDSATSVRFSPDGTYLLVSTNGGAVRRIDLGVPRASDPFAAFLRLFPDSPFRPQALERQRLAVIRRQAVADAGEGKRLPPEDWAYVVDANVKVLQQPQWHREGVLDEIERVVAAQIEAARERGGPCKPIAGGTYWDAMAKLMGELPRDTPAWTLVWKKLERYAGERFAFSRQEGAPEAWRLLETAPGRVQFGRELFAKGVGKIEEKKYEEAVPLLRESAEILPFEPRACAAYALALARGRGETNVAADVIDFYGRHEEVAVDPLVAGLAFVLLKRYDDAIAELQKGERSPKGSSEAKVLLGLAYLEKGDLDQAVRVYESLGASGYDPGEVRRGLVMACLKKGDLAGALRVLETAKEQDLPKADADIEKALQEETSAKGRELDASRFRSLGLLPTLPKGWLQ